MRIFTGLEATIGDWDMLDDHWNNEFEKTSHCRTEMTLSHKLVDSCSYPHSHRGDCSHHNFKCLKKDVPMLQMHVQASTRASSSARDFPKCCWHMPYLLVQHPLQRFYCLRLLPSSHCSHAISFSLRVALVLRREAWETVVIVVQRATIVQC